MLFVLVFVIVLIFRVFAVIISCFCLILRLGLLQILSNAYLTIKHIRYLTLTRGNYPKTGIQFLGIDLSKTFAELN